MKKNQIVALGVTILPLAVNAVNGIEVKKVASNANYPESNPVSIELPVDSAINLQEVTV